MIALSGRWFPKSPIDWSISLGKPSMSQYDERTGLFITIINAFTLFTLIHHIVAKMKKDQAEALMAVLQLLTEYLSYYLETTQSLNSDMCQFIHCARKLQLIAAALPRARVDCSSSIFGIKIPRIYLFCHKILKGEKRKFFVLECIMTWK